MVIMNGCKMTISKKNCIMIAIAQSNMTVSKKSLADEIRVCTIEIKHRVTIKRAKEVARILEASLVDYSKK
jgi:hypothetical protein